MWVFVGRAAPSLSCELEIDVSKLLSFWWPQEWAWITSHHNTGTRTCDLSWHFSFGVECDTRDGGIEMVAVWLEFEFVGHWKYKSIHRRASDRVDCHNKN